MKDKLFVHDHYHIIHLTELHRFTDESTSYSPPAPSQMPWCTEGVPAAPEVQRLERSLALGGPEWDPASVGNRHHQVELNQCHPALQDQRGNGL